MDLVLGLHGRVAYALVLYYAAVGLWGIFLGVRDRAPSPGFRGAVTIATAVAFVQGALGLVLLFLYRGPTEGVHVLYGFALVVAMPLAWSLTQGRSPRGQSIALGLAALFTAGLAIRGITTA